MDTYTNKPVRWLEVFNMADTLVAAQETGLHWKEVIRSRFKGNLGEKGSGFYGLTYYSDIVAFPASVQITENFEVIHYLRGGTTALKKAETTLIYADDKSKASAVGLTEEEYLERK